MDTGITLKSIFASGKEDLSKELSGLSLPKDAKKIQDIVTEFLGKLFENDGRFRQSLTESEDYILHASLELLKAQQDVSNEFAKKLSNSDESNVSLPKKQSHSSNNVSVNGIGVSLCAGVGALAGSFMGTVAAMAGAIAGTALVIYFPNIIGLIKGQEEEKKDEKQSIANTEIAIDSESFCDIIEKICEKIDGVIATYRTQVKNIANTYNKREQPSLLNSYSLLTEQIANVIQTSRACGDEIPSKLKTAIAIMEESLENYELKFIDGKIVIA